MPTTDYEPALGYLTTLVILLQRQADDLDAVTAFYDADHGSWLADVLELFGATEPEIAALLKRFSQAEATQPGEDAGGLRDLADDLRRIARWRLAVSD